MAAAFDEALRIALTLSSEERRALVERVGETLPDDEDDDPELTRELQRRIDAANAGQPGIPAATVHAHLEAVIAQVRQVR